MARLLVRKVMGSSHLCISSALVLGSSGGGGGGAAACGAGGAAGGGLGEDMSVRCYT